MKRKEKPIIQSEWLAVQGLIEHERTFEIVTDKEVSWGVKGNWKTRCELKQRYESAKDHFSRVALSNRTLSEINFFD